MLSSYLSGRQIDTMRVPGGVDQLGFDAKLNTAGSLMVTVVQPGTWASENSLNIGDEILEMNSEEVRTINAGEIAATMSRRPLDLLVARQLREGQGFPRRV